MIRFDDMQKLGAMPTLIVGMLAVSPRSLGKHGTRTLLVLVMAVAASRAPADDWSSILVLPEGADGSIDPAAVAEYARPTPTQAAYQEKQLGAFCHFGLPTYARTAEEYAAVYPLSPGMPDASRFDPPELDAEQWVLAAKSFGAKHFVFPCKHHDGFCLWPTKTTEYCVRNTPWKNGRGDVVAEVAAACRKHGMALGIYCSPADKHAGCYSTWERKLVGDREAYFLKFKEQLRELLTDYGEAVVVWLDNCLDPFGGDVVDPKTGKAAGPRHDREIHALIRSLQPGAVIMHPFCSRSDVLHPGNEEGRAPYPLWNVVRRGQVRKESWMLPETEGWLLAEPNIHPRPKWIWTPDTDDKIMTVERLMEAYYTSIGRGANLLVNLTPDTRGLIPDAEMKRMADFGAEIRRQLGKLIAETESHRGWTRPGVLELDLGQTATLGHVVLEEAIAHGQHVLVYELDVFDEGRWTTVARGESIGRKRIERFAVPVRAQRVRLRVLKANAVPLIRTLAAHAAASSNRP